MTTSEPDISESADTVSEAPEAEGPVSEAPELTARSSRARKLRRRGGLMLILALFVLGVGGVFSLTGGSVVAPDWVTTRIENTFNQRIQAGGMSLGRLSLGQIEVIVDRGMRPRALIRDVGLYDGRGAELARLNEVRARINATALMRGIVTVDALSVSGAQITVRRAADGTFDLSLGEGSATSGTLAGVLDGLDRAFATAPLSDLRSIRADQLTITLEDGRSGRLWQVTEGRIDLVQTAEHLELTVNADVFNGTEELATTVIEFRTEKGSPQASLTATFENAAAGDIAAQSPGLAFLSVLDAQIAGALSASISDLGEIEGLSGSLMIGRGALQPTPDTPPIAFDSARAFVEYDSAAQTVQVRQLSLQSETATVAAEGVALLQDFRAGWPETLVGQFALSEATVQPKGVFAEPMKFAQGAIDFRLRLDPFTVEIGQVALLQDNGPDSTAGRFNGKGRVSANDEGWTVAMDLALNTITLDRLLALWPVAAVQGTREWLGTNVLDAEIRDLTGALRFAPQARPLISVSYLFSGATVQALENLPPISGASGYASLNDKAYTMVFEEGQVEAAQGGILDVQGSVLHIPDVSIELARMQISLETDSSIEAVLSLLDQPPLEAMTNARQPVDLAQGRAIVSTQIGFAIDKVIPFEAIEWTAKGRLLNVSSDKLVEGRVIRAPTLEAQADPTGLTISGAGTLGKLPVRALWRQEFGPDVNGRSALEGTVELSQTFLDEFGIALPPGSVTGSGVAQLKVDFARDEAPEFLLTSDLNRVGLSLKELDWSKPRNQTGTLDVAGRFGKTPKIDRLALSAPGMTASGVIDLTPNGALDIAQFDRVQVGGWLDGPVTLTGRGNRAPAVAVNGGVIDLRKASFGPDGGGTAASSGGAAQEGGPMSLTLDRLIVSEGISLTDFRGEFKAGGALEGRFVGRVNGAAAIEGSVVPTPSGGAIRLISSQAGDVLSAAGILRNARGGTMDLTLNPTGQTGIYSGRLAILNTRIMQAPALTEMLSAISIVGLLDQMNNGGISLSEIEAEFSLGPERMTLYRSSAIGPSLGISLDGVYDLVNNRLDMQGVVSPVYFLNGIGQIFSRGKDGLFGFNFRLSGAGDDPKVSVNPLSILTPGAFREIFRRPPPKQNVTQ